MMHVYLFNRSGSDNIGDQLIGSVTTSLLEEIGCIVTQNTIYQLPEGKIGALTTHLWSYASDIRQVSRCDVLIVGGGNLIMDTGVGARWAFHQSWLSILSLLSRKRYYYLCVGATPLETPSARVLYHFALRFAAGISVRDNVTKDYLEQFTGRDDIMLMFDPVLLVSSLYPRHSVPRSASVGICPAQLYPSICADIDVYHKYVELHVKLVEYFLSAGKKVVLFLNDPTYDQQVFLDILSHTSVSASGFHTQVRFSGLQDYLDFIAGLDSLVSSRMHAIVCATSYGIPSIGLGWQPKMKSFFRDQGLTGCLDIVERLAGGALADDVLHEIVQLHRLIPEPSMAQFSETLDLEQFLGLCGDRP